MKSKKANTFLCHALVSSIVVLMIGFLGLGVCAFVTADTAKFIFVAAFVVSVVILVLFHAPSIHSRSDGPFGFPCPPFVKRSLFLRLSAWRPSGGQRTPLARPALRVGVAIETSGIEHLTNRGHAVCGEARPTCSMRATSQGPHRLRTGIGTAQIIA